MNDLLKERVLLILALLLCIAVVLLSVWQTPEFAPVSVAYTDSTEMASSGTSASGSIATVSASTGSLSTVSTTTLTAESTASTSAPKTSTTTSAAGKTGKININTASKEALMELDGIGETLAQRIIDYRETYGGFDSIEEIQQVSGIGDKRYAAIKDYITVN